MTSAPSTAAPLTFSWAVVGVPALAPAVEFYTRTAGLRLTAQDPDGQWADFHVGRERRCLRAEVTGRSEVLRMAYAVTGDDLAVIADRLAAAGRATEEVRGDGATYGLLFDDPDGNHLELHVDPVECAAPPPPGNRPDKLLHPLLNVADLAASVGFYVDVLGFRVSDRIADVAAFLRCHDGYHHSMAMQVRRPDADRPIDHLCFHIDDFDTLMRIRARVRAHGSTTTELFRHGGSESRSNYFPDPHSGVDLEYCSGHRRITDPDHRPRVLPAEAQTFDMWQRFD